MYKKEFVDLCAGWIRGTISDKSKFKEYQDLMKSQSIKTTGFRIWTFDPCELKNVIFNEGDIEIESNIIESCFVLNEDDLVNPFSDKKQHIENHEIDSIQRWISPYLDKTRIITRWANSDYFDVYKVLKFGVEEYKNGNKDYSKEDFVQYNRLLKFYSNQKEMFHLGEYDNISSDEIIFIMIEKELVNDLMNDKLKNVIYDELQEYYLFYNDDETRDVIYNHSDLKYEFNEVFMFRDL